MIDAIFIAAALLIGSIFSIGLYALSLYAGRHDAAHRRKIEKEKV